MNESNDEGNTGYLSIREAELLIERLKFEISQKASRTDLSLMETRLNEAERDIKDISIPWYKRRTVIGYFLGFFFLVLIYIAQSTTTSKPLSHFLHDTLGTKKVISDEIMQLESPIKTNLESFLQNEVNEKNTWFQSAFRSLAKKYPTNSFYRHYKFGEEKYLILTDKCRREIKNYKPNIIDKLNDECWIKKKNQEEFSLPFYSSFNDDAYVLAVISRTKVEDGNDTSIDISKEKFPLEFQVDDKQDLTLNQESLGSKIFIALIEAKSDKRPELLRGSEVVRFLRVKPIKEFDYQSEIDVHVMILTIPSKNK